MTLTFYLQSMSHVEVYGVLVELLGVTVLSVSGALEGGGAPRGGWQGARGLFSVTLKVPFITVFMIPGLSCADTQTAVRRALQCVGVKYVGLAHNPAHHFTLKTEPDT